MRTSPFFDQSGFIHKKLCDGRTFTAGTACAYSCTYCYVEGQTLRHEAVSQVLQHSKRPFNKVVIRRADAARQIAIKITRRAGKKAVNGRHAERCEDLLGEVEAVRLGLQSRVAIYRGKAFSQQVLFASAFVDVAATKELALETVEICTVLLQLTDFHIRLLSKSPLLYEIVAVELARRHPEAKARMIFGLSAGTLDDAIARAIEPDAPSPTQRLEALRKLQDAGFRTFGMVCLILSQADPRAYAEQVMERIRPARCEHIWAEPVGQDIANSPSVTTGAAGLKAPAGNARIASLAIGQRVKASGKDLLEELGTVAAAIKDHRNAPFSHQGTHLVEYAGQHLDQTGVGLGGDDKQRIARHIVDPVVRGGRHRDTHASHMGFGQRMLAVVNPHVTVGVEETQGGSAQGNPLLGQSLAELNGPSGGGQTCQLAPQRFDFRRPVQPQHSAQVLGRIFLETLRTFDSPERHEQERKQAGAQSVKGRPKAAIDFLRALENAAGRQDRQGQENSSPWNRSGSTKQRRRILQQAQTRQQSVTAPMARIGVVAGRASFCGCGAKSGQVWVRTWWWQRSGSRHRTGQVWVRRPNFFQRQQILLGRGLFPAQPMQHLADGHLADSQTPCNFSIGLASCLETMDQPGAPRRQAPASFGISVQVAQGGQTVILESPLIPTHRSCRATEGPSHLLLTGPALLNEIHHGVSLRHPIRYGILCQNNARHQHHTVAVLLSHQTPLVDDAGAWRIPQIRKKIITVVSAHIRRSLSRVFKKADRFGFAPSRVSIDEKTR